MQLSISQSPHQKPTLPRAWSWTSSLQQLWENKCLLLKLPNTICKKKKKKKILNTVAIQNRCRQEFADPKLNDQERNYFCKISLNKMSEVKQYILATWIRSYLLWNKEHWGLSRSSIKLSLLQIQRLYHLCFPLRTYPQSCYYIYPALSLSLNSFALLNYHNLPERKSNALQISVNKLTIRWSALERFQNLDLLLGCSHSLVF